MEGIVVTKFPDPAWGDPSIARVIPIGDDPWGILRFLVGTPWDPLFPRIPEDILDQALRGHTTPLMRILGPPPKALAKRLPVEDGTCRMKDQCINAGPLCIPGLKVPMCWEPQGVSPYHSPYLSHVVQLWRVGIVVVLVVKGQA